MNITSCEPTVIHSEFDLPAYAAPPLVQPALRFSPKPDAPVAELEGVRDRSALLSATERIPYGLLGRPEELRETRGRQ
jgi:hypothetical protein